jgi:hypothetical protein
VKGKNQPSTKDFTKKTNKRKINKWKMKPIKGSSK